MIHIEQIKLTNRNKKAVDVIVWKRKGRKKICQLFIIKILPNCPHHIRDTIILENNENLWVKSKPKIEMVSHCVITQ